MFPKLDFHSDLLPTRIKLKHKTRVTQDLQYVTSLKVLDCDLMMGQHLELQKDPRVRRPPVQRATGFPPVPRLAPWQQYHGTAHRRRGRGGGCRGGGRQRLSALDGHLAWPWPIRGHRRYRVESHGGHEISRRGLQMTRLVNCTFLICVCAHMCCVFFWVSSMQYKDLDSRVILIFNGM